MNLYIIISLRITIKWLQTLTEKIRIKDTNNGVNNLQGHIWTDNRERRFRRIKFVFETCESTDVESIDVAFWNRCEFWTPTEALIRLDASR